MRDNVEKLDKGNRKQLCSPLTEKKASFRVEIKSIYNGKTCTYLYFEEKKRSLWKEASYLLTIPFRGTALS